MVKVMIACHKPCELPEDELYLPLHVGAACHESSGDETFEAYTRDDTGDNISSLNPMYCELTGLYWMWRNTDYEYVGLSHYRRYFRSSLGGKSSVEDAIGCDEIEAIFDMNPDAVVVPRMRDYYIESVYSHYSHTFDGRQLDIVREILSERYPGYLRGFDRVMSGRRIYIFNMFVMNRRLLSDYCSWLFDVLGELEKRYDTTGMTDFEKRYIGRVSERLFNVWLYHRLETGVIRRSDIVELPYVYVGGVNWLKKGTAFLRAKFLGVKYEESF